MSHILTEIDHALAAHDARRGCPLPYRSLELLRDEVNVDAHPKPTL